MDYDGIQLELSKNVYQPAEDSFLLVEQAKKLRGRILEIGCGSGIISLICAREGGKETQVRGVDINPEAVECAKANAKRNNINAEFIESNLFEKVPKTKFNGIVFNPPYLPTEEEEKIEGELNHAFDGGIDGRVVLERFLNEFSDYLDEDGVVLLVQSSLNDFDRTIERLKALGYETRVEAEEKFFFEKIYVVSAKLVLP